MPIGDGDGDECDPDDDDDGYSDGLEGGGGIGTTRFDNCTNTSGPGPGPNSDAWPSDMNLDDIVGINDVTGPFAPHFGAIMGVDPTGTNPGDAQPAGGPEPGRVDRDQRHHGPLRAAVRQDVHLSGGCDSGCRRWRAHGARERLTSLAARI